MVEKSKKASIGTTEKAIIYCIMATLAISLISAPAISGRLFVVSATVASENPNSIMPLSPLGEPPQQQDGLSAQDQDSTDSTNVTTAEAPDGTSTTAGGGATTTTPVPLPTGPPGTIPGQGPVGENQTENAGPIGQNQTENPAPVGQNQTQTSRLAPSAQPPSPPPSTQGTSTIVLQSGATGAPGSPDSMHECSLDGGKTWQKAYVVPKAPAYDIISNPKTQYISCSPDGSGAANFDTWYRVNFTLPVCFVNASLNVTIHADNYAAIYLNSPSTNLADPAHFVGAQSSSPNPPSANFQVPPESYVTSNPALFLPRTNTLYFKVHNDDFVTAFDYVATVTFTETRCTGVPPPGGGNINVGNVSCPSKNVQHWDKIVFSITNPRLASSVNQIPNTPLDIKVLDDPNSVADIKKKVLNFLKVQDNPQNRNAISIFEIEYAIICAG